MKIHEISDDECRAVLARAAMGRLGCALDNQPYVVPIAFAYEPEYIYAFSTVGQKVEWMRLNPKVCLQVDEVAGPSEWVSVIASGVYEELPEAQRASDRAHARELLEQRHNWWLNAVAGRREKVDELSIDPLFFRIHIDAVSGIRARDGESKS